MNCNDDMEKLKREFLGEMNDANVQWRKAKKKKRLKICLVILGIIVLVKVMFGTIEINSFLPYPSNQTRFYKLTINDKLTTVYYHLKHKIPLIPFLVHFNSYYSGGSYVNDDDSTSVVADGTGKYILDISSYSCYSGKIQVECKNINQEMKEETDTKFTNLRVHHITYPNEEIYNGKFTNDISKYVEKKGQYLVEMTAKYSFIETKIYFNFIIK